MVAVEEIMHTTLEVWGPLEELLFYGFITTLVAAFLVAVSKENSSLDKYSELNEEQVSMYECGFEPFQEPQDSFFIQYFSIAVLFLVFELELLYLLPWVLLPDLDVLKNLSLVYCFYTAVLLGLALEWKAESFNWLKLQQYN